MGDDGAGDLGLKFTVLIRRTRMTPKAIAPVAPLTKRQVLKSMQLAGIEGEVRGSGQNWEVELPNEKALKAFHEKVAKVGGYKTGYGAWVLSPNYKDPGDWSKPSSRWHY